MKNKKKKKEKGNNEKAEHRCPILILFHTQYINWRNTFRLSSHKGTLY